jgi:hypothetical protein
MTLTELGILKQVQILLSRPLQMELAILVVFRHGLKKVFQQINSQEVSHFMVAQPVSE